MQPKLTIVVPTLNEERRIAKLLAMLERQTLKDYEVIVGDANSTDRTREIAKAHGARIVPGGHQAVGRNNGAHVAKADVVLFLDADVVFDNKFLENCYNDFVRLGLDMACCYFDIRPLSLKMKIIYTMWNSSKFVRRKTKTADGEGQVIWMRRSAFNKVGGFDVRLKIAEDVDLIHRTIAKGYKYDVLNYKFVPSTRRYEKVGMLRVFAGSFIGGMGQLLGVIGVTGISEKIYGGWGTFGSKKK